MIVNVSALGSTPCSRFSLSQGPTPRLEGVTMPSSPHSSICDSSGGGAHSTGFVGRIRLVTGCSGRHKWNGGRRRESDSAPPPAVSKSREARRQAERIAKVAPA
eukprot:scaffold234740_cov28-Tisochrysis_lutea.AAC.2